MNLKKIQKYKLFRCWYFSNVKLLKYNCIYWLEYDPSKVMYLWQKEISEIGCAEADFLCMVLKEIKNKTFEKLRSHNYETTFSFSIMVKPVGAPLYECLTNKILKELKLELNSKELLFEIRSPYAIGTTYNVTLT